jgi:hypothetical protein
MQLHEETGHGVEQSVAHRGRPGWEPGEKPPVLEGARQIGGHEGRGVAFRGGGEADRRDRWELAILEVAKDIELRLGDPQRFLLESDHAPIGREEPNEMA